LEMDMANLRNVIDVSGSRRELYYRKSKSTSWLCNARHDMRGFEPKRPALFLR
jgi:hypothetical protein